MIFCTLAGLGESDFMFATKWRGIWDMSVNEHQVASNAPPNMDSRFRLIIIRSIIGVFRCTVMIRCRR